MAAKPLTSETIALTEKKMDMTLDDIIKMSKNTVPQTKKQHRVPNKSQKAFSNTVQEKAFKVRQYMGSRSSVRQGVLAQRRSNFQGNHFPLTNEVARKATYAPARNRAFNGSTVPNRMNRARSFVASVANELVLFSWSWKLEVAQQEVFFSLNIMEDCPFLLFLRVGALPVHRRSNGAFAKRPQTLDSLFANMKEQRMKVLSRQNNNNNNNNNNNSNNNNNNGGVQRNGGGRLRPPWVRGRVGN
ncbi:hypothetical protein JRO89_XS13G0139600 [Xanthoceras sorbifolium]|uniref:Uncharacterized protein n=1 Tax=Xanthoceras sorbifolium TaxID=99658 RepID=A0ABQ8H876_9ROSI|nr:hypothetical protein JRO89_XS13G0139600 [Xanthoceras sorbifolium]